MFRSLAKAVFTPRSAREVAQDIGTAIATALDPPRGPVYMDIPADVLRAAAVEAPVLAPPVPRAVDEAALAAAAGMRVVTLTALGNAGAVVHFTRSGDGSAA